MISFDAKSETTSSLPMNLKGSDEKSSVDFSKFLKLMGTKKDTNIIQNGTLVLSLDGKEKDVKNIKTVTKNETILSLLKNDDLKSIDVKETLELNPALTNILKPKEVKTLISKAKNYLKSKILQSDSYKQSQIKELPKTLKGLALLAKKVGVDISKITLEEVHPKAKIIKATLKAEEDKPKIIKTAKILKEEVRVTTISSKEMEIETEFILKDRVHDRRMKDDKDIPIFKPLVSKTKEQHTTQQLVEVKQFKVEEKTPKERANETLKLLLRGEKPSEESQNLTSDFSVQTAKVIAPSIKTESSKELESLLHDKLNSSKDNVTDTKTEHTISVHKADSFEVKLNEAKQMIKYLSQDVKTAIEDYKSPFTRVKVQLNPQRLGEIDLTVVQRGKNLHVNLSSNSTAINTLSMNATELKVQLQNSGINNASLNFSDSGSQGNNAQTSGGQHQNEKQAEEEYSYLQKEEANEELLSSLEIIVPRYI